jgi:hypothetical protein
MNTGERMIPTNLQTRMSLLVAHSKLRNGRSA